MENLKGSLSLGTMLSIILRDSPDLENNHDELAKEVEDVFGVTCTALNIKEYESLEIMQYV